jgi:N-acetylmuramoyl-L-alanine amidase
MTPLKRYIKAALCLLGTLVLFAATVLSAQENGPASVRARAALHGDRVRVVFTAEGFSFAKTAAVLNKDKTIVVDLRPDMSSPEGAVRPFKAHTDRWQLRDGYQVELLKGVVLTLRGTTFTINSANIRDIRAGRLHSPSRLVIDISYGAPQREDPGQTAALRPLAEQLSMRSFVIDAGHGGYEYGIRGSRFSEKEFALSFARDMAAALSRSGRDALLVRKSDVVMPLSERIAVANRRAPDIFMSIHVSPGKTATVYVVPDRQEEGARALPRHKKEVSWRVADLIVKNLEREFSITAVKTELPLPLLMLTRCPAIIIELPSPDELSYDKRSRERMLSAIMRGLAAGARDMTSREEKKLPAVNRPETGADKKAVERPEKHPGRTPALKNGAKAEPRNDRRTRVAPTQEPEVEAEGD